MNETERLRAENARLREALGQYALRSSWGYRGEVGGYISKLPQPWRIATAALGIEGGCAATAGQVDAALAGSPEAPRPRTEAAEEDRRGGPLYVDPAKAIAKNIDAIRAMIRPGNPQGFGEPAPSAEPPGTTHYPWLSLDQFHNLSVAELPSAYAELEATVRELERRMDWLPPEEVERRVSEAVAAERERCARIADDRLLVWPEVAAAIRKGPL